MCGHQFKTINDISVCTKCGLTFAGGKAFFDKKIVDRKKKVKKR